MSRPSRAEKRKNELLPLVAGAFSELGYRRATTAEIAARCGVRENILYRLWDDKKAMFLASIDYLFQWQVERFRAVLDRVPEGENPLVPLLDLVARDLGELGLYRIIHAALSETHDPEIRDALRAMYQHNHELVMKLLEKRGNDGCLPGTMVNQDATWGMMGMVTIMDLACELEMLGPRQRKAHFTRVARVMLGLPDE